MPSPPGHLCSDSPPLLLFHLSRVVSFCVLPFIFPSPDIFSYFTCLLSVFLPFRPPKPWFCFAFFLFIWSCFWLYLPIPCSALPFLFVPTCLHFLPSPYVSPLSSLRLPSILLLSSRLSYLIVTSVPCATTPSKQRFLELHPNAPYALSMLLTHGSAEILPALADLSRDVFDALDGYDSEHTTAYALILRE